MSVEFSMVWRRRRFRQLQADGVVANDQSEFGERDMKLVPINNGSRDSRAKGTETLEGRNIRGEHRGDVREFAVRQRWLCLMAAICG
jgi:hypothetical protein